MLEAPALFVVAHPKGVHVHIGRYSVVNLAVQDDVREEQKDSQRKQFDSQSGMHGESNYVYHALTTNLLAGFGLSSASGNGSGIRRAGYSIDFAPTSDEASKGGADVRRSTVTYKERLISWKGLFGLDGGPNIRITDSRLKRATPPTELHRSKSYGGQILFFSTAVGSPSAMDEPPLELRKPR